jgi:WG repeat protein
MPAEGALFPIFVREGRSRKKFKTGYINKNGDVVVPPALDYGYPFREGLASFRKGDLWGAIDHHGKVVIPPCSGQPLVFAEKLAEFSSGGKRGVMNIAGQVLVPPRYRSISYYSGGLACYGLNRSAVRIRPTFQFVNLEIYLSFTRCLVPG